MLVGVIYIGSNKLHTKKLNHFLIAACFCVSVLKIQNPSNGAK